MKKILILFILFSSVPCLFSAFEELQQSGTRPAGLGNAFTGLADDINTQLINPAGLLLINRMTFLLSGSALYPGLEESIYRGNILSALPLLTRLHFAAGYSFLYTEYYRENMVNLAAAYALQKGLFLGVNNKLLSWTGQVVSLFGQEKADYSSAVLSFDLGLLYLISDHFSFGISFMDINQPDISSDTSQVSDDLPLKYKWGLGYRDTFLKAGLDFAYKQDVLSQHLGLEYAVIKQFLWIRSGLSLFDLTVRGYQVNLGFSIDSRLLNRPFRIDYSFGFNEIRESLGTHNFAFIFSI